MSFASGRHPLIVAVINGLLAQGWSVRQATQRLRVDGETVSTRDILAALEALGEAAPVEAPDPCTRFVVLDEALWPARGQCEGRHRGGMAR